MIRLIASLAGVWLLTQSGFAADLRVPALFGDNACVQAGRPVAVWGWAKPGAKVVVTLGDSAAEVTAGPGGRWLAEIPALKPGGPHVLTIKSGAEEVRSENILAGEVWLASGQSNLFFPVGKTQDAAKDVPAARHPEIRLFRCEVLPSYETASEPRGRWEVCSPETVPEFSGVAYFFGERIHRELGFPVGLIQASLGGTPIEGWLPPELWKEGEDFARIHREQEGYGDSHMRKKYERAVAAWKRRGSPADAEPPAPDYSRVDQNDPSVCFNAAIAPLVPYTLAGFVWYQGEWNTGRAGDYGKLLAQLVTKWRTLWGGGDLPFLVVQLPAIGTKTSGSSVDPKSGWAALREQQASVRSLPKTGLAVTIDLGGELHPPRKREVGERLARLALAEVYGRGGVSQGPVLKSATPQDGRIVLAFDHAEGMTLQPVDGRTGFAVAGDDKVFHAAQAIVDGGDVIVSSAAVPAPRHVRYLWAQNPSATLYNAAQLPAGPFRTDDWPDARAADNEKPPTAK